MLTRYRNHINLSKEALKFYSYQRCITKNMSHSHAQEYAFEFHFKIFNQIKPYLQKGTTSVDFGCGIGVINIFTSVYFEKLWLIDNTVSETSLKNTFYGFHGKGYNLQDDKADAPQISQGISSTYCFYNDMSLTRETLINNNVNCEIQCMTPDELSIKPSSSVDLIQSHMSWGWHFPFSQYKQLAHRLLRNNGTLITDIRNNSLAENDLHGFKVIDRLENREKNSLKYVLIKC